MLIDKCWVFQTLFHSYTSCNADLGTEGGPQACTPADSTAGFYSDICIDGNTYHLHLSPLQSTHESETHGSLSISKCVVAEEDPINTSDHLPILAEIRNTQPCRAAEPDTF